MALILALTFLALHLLPGGPFDEDTALSTEMKSRLEYQYGLKQPLVQQFTIYVRHLLSGELGESYRYNGQSIGKIFAQGFPVSLSLGVWALIVAIGGGLALGILCARRHRGKLDEVINLSALVIMSFPTFVVGPLLIYIFSFQLNLLPAGLWEGPSFMILPVITLALRPMSLVLRMTRRSALEVLSEDYIRTARAKGVSMAVLLYKHILKNSLPPVLTLFGGLIAELLTGAFVIEFMFAIPGLGRHFVESVNNRDYPLVLATTLLFSAILITANWIMDLVHRLLDPRMEAF